MMLLYEADSKGISASDVLAAQISETDELTTMFTSAESTTPPECVTRTR